MFNQLQVTGATHYDRYPDVFALMADISLMQTVTHGKVFPKEVLSFGCSTGEEVRALSLKYFPNARITGTDIDIEAIKTCQQTFMSPSKARYMHIAELAPEDLKYDIIFCMSVLCRMRDNINEPPIEFTDFNNTIKALHEKLNAGGYMVVYNCNYYFLDSDVGKKYIPVITRHLQKSFSEVKMYYPDGKHEREDNTACIFKKK